MLPTCFFLKIGPCCLCLFGLFNNGVVSVSSLVQSGSSFVESVSSFVESVSSLVSLVQSESGFVVSASSLEHLVCVQCVRMYVKFCTVRG